jgi:hypothetical protein
VGRRKIDAAGSPPAAWVRVCVAIDGFRLAHGRWPTRVRLDPGQLAELVSGHLHPAGFALVSSVVDLVPDEQGMPTAEDRTGAKYVYSRDDPLPAGDLGLPAVEWFGRAVLRRPWG